MELEVWQAAISGKSRNYTFGVSRKNNNAQHLRIFEVASP
jgi:hypothetical protein